jgi:NADPH-dependent 2,4-dienoyl-CoA reductase/sulfur reductase-like enzyme/rhodanese-related sulfurtransferase
MRKEDFQDDPTRFAGLIAHQIQAPLSSLSQALQTVLDEFAGPLQPRQRDVLQRANLRCEQAMLSVRRMLTILEAQQGAVSVAPAHLGNVIRRTQALYEEQAARRHMRLEVDLALDRPYVRLGEAALTEVLSALLNNAMKYTPDRGHVRIRAAGAEGESAACLCVEDSGTGIPEEALKDIFEPFYRTSTARKSTQPGMGLGLAFVKSVLQAAGGGVEAARSDLGGAAFHVTLPLADVGEAGATEEQQPPRFKVVIVGGAAAGAKAAAKILRLRSDAHITVVEKEQFLPHAGCGLPYFVSGLMPRPGEPGGGSSGIDSLAVVRDPPILHNRRQVRILRRTEALRVNRAEQYVEVRDRNAQRTERLPYDRLLLSTGASAVIPDDLNVSMKKVFTLHGMRDAEGIRAVLAASEVHDVVIVGGGLIGLEMTEALVSRGARVTIIEKQPRILPILDADMAILLERHLAVHGVRVVTDTRVRSLEGGEAVRAVRTEGGTFPADMVILAIGVKANIALAEQAGLDIGETGAVVVDEYLRTSDPSIYAAGDCVQTRHLLTGRSCYIPLGSTAIKQARAAAVNLCGGSDPFRGVIGSCICRVFDYTVARTGLGEQEAREYGFDPITVLVPGPDRDAYMSTAKLLLLKLIVDRSTRRLLGAQATGEGAADKRIDVAALAVSGGMTIDEVAGADLCYAPPYSEAMDNLITAANVMRNKLDGHMEGMKPAEVWGLLKEGSAMLLLDVRTPEEHERGHLPNAVLMPLGSLRERADELPRDRLIVAYGTTSLRAYEAALALKTEGFSRVRVLEGGMAMWPYDRVG